MAFSPFVAAACVYTLCIDLLTYPELHKMVVAHDGLEAERHVTQVSLSGETLGQNQRPLRQSCQVELHGEG